MFLLVHLRSHLREEGFSSRDGTPTVENESLNGRMVSRYAGITTTLSANIADAVTTSVSLTNVGEMGLRIGDYLDDR